MEKKKPLKKDNEQIYIVTESTYDGNGIHGHHRTYEGAMKRAKKVMKSLDKEYKRLCNMVLNGKKCSSFKYVPFEEYTGPKHPDTLHIWKQSHYDVIVSKVEIEE